MTSRVRRDARTRDPDVGTNLQINGRKAHARAIDAKPTIVLVHGSTRRAGAGTVEIEGYRVIMGEHDRCEPGVRTRRSAR